MQSKTIMGTNDFYGMSADKIRGNALWYERNGVYSIAREAYECLMHLGGMRKGEYLRLTAIYLRRLDIINANRIIGRYKAIYGS